MPSIYTHDYFAKDVFKELKDLKNVKKINDPKYYQIFAQSFDHLFCYNFLSLKKGKKFRRLGYYAHTHKTWKYFKTIITYIKENKLYDDENLGYLYGSLTHYALDSTAHPYIHYISGKFYKNNFKATKKYMGIHAKNEIMIDAIYYYKNNSEKYYKFKLYKELIPITKFPESLKSNIDNAFFKTFNKENLGYIYNKSYNQNHYIYKYLMYDRTGLKKTLYKIFDFLIPFKKFKANTYSHHITKIDNSVLNIEKNEWLHPLTGEKHNESFYELYDIAYKKVIKYIKKINDYFNDKCKIEDVEKVLGNISYSSGLDVDIRGVFSYFKY